MASKEREEKDGERMPDTPLTAVVVIFLTDYCRADLPHISYDTD